MAGSILIPLKTVFDDKGLKQAQSSFGKLGGSLKGILGAAGIAVGLSSIVSSLQDAAKAAIEDTKSQALLANQLRNTVGASNEQIVGVERSIAAMQKQAAVADDEIRPAFASLVRATGDVATATKLTSLALDVAAGTGKDLGAVSLALGKAVNGSTTSLVKLVPSIKGASDPMGVLADQFKGAAEAAANNDPIKQISIIFGELQEQVGTYLLPALQDLADFMASDQFADGMENIWDGFDKIYRAFTNVTNSIPGLKSGFDGLGKIFQNGDWVKLIPILGAYIDILAGEKPSVATGGSVIDSYKFNTNQFGKKTSPDDLTPDKPTTKKAVTDYVKEFGTNLADELRKQMARIRLGNKGLSEGLIESIIGSGAGWYKVYQSILNSSDTALGRLQKNFNATAAGIDEIAKAAEDAITPTQKLFASIGEDVKKQTARAALQGMGASGGLIEAILGSGDDWAKVYADILASGSVGLAALQAQFNATAAGLNEIADVAAAAAALAKEASDKLIAAAEDAVAKAEDAVSKLGALADEARAEVDKYAKYFNPLPKTVIEVYDAAVENLARLQEESARTLDNMTAGMADIRAEVNKSAQSFKDLAKTAEPIGAWESKVNDSFANITASAQKAFDNKLITEDAYKNLMAYAGREQKLLADIAKKRDALAEKISLAKALYSDTRAAVVSFGNITGLLKQQSETVTETTSKVVDGVAVLISRTIEKVSSTDLVAEYKKIIDKTRAFATNLNALKSMGLNKDLFKQIIDAGVDVGGETAAAIAAGGPAVVGELNGLFAELQTVGDQVAETTTVVMYNNGVDVVGGFINGLLSEDEGLAAAATTIATLFADTFKVMLDGAMSSVLSAMKSQLDMAIATAQAAVDAALVKMKAAYDKAVADAKAATDAANKAKADADAAAAALKKLVTPEPTSTTTPAPIIVNPPAPIQFDPGDFIPVGRGAGALGFKGGSSLVDGGATINLTVNAGLGTNGAQLGGQIVELIKKYEKSSGAVFA